MLDLPVDNECGESLSEDNVTASPGSGQVPRALVGGPRHEDSGPSVFPSHCIPSSICLQPASFKGLKPVLVPGSTWSDGSSQPGCMPKCSGSEIIRVFAWGNPGSDTGVKPAKGADGLKNAAGPESLRETGCVASLSSRVCGEYEVLDDP